MFSTKVRIVNTNSGPFPYRVDVKRFLFWKKGVRVHHSKTGMSFDEWCNDNRMPCRPYIDRFEKYKHAVNVCTYLIDKYAKRARDRGTEQITHEVTVIKGWF